MVLRLEQCGVAPEQVDGVLLTHEHGDHVCGLEVFARKFKVPIYCNPSRLKNDPMRCRVRGIRPTSKLAILSYRLKLFRLRHHGGNIRCTARRGPIRSASRLYAGTGSLGFITDLGYATKMIVERLREMRTIVIETNHDEKLLQNDKHRPWPVKQRIQSRMVISRTRRRRA